MSLASRAREIERSSIEQDIASITAGLIPGQVVDLNIGHVRPSSEVLAEKFNELAVSIGGALDTECDDLIETLKMIKAANAAYRKKLGEKAVAYAREVSDLSGAAADIKERVKLMTVEGSADPERGPCPVCGGADQHEIDCTASNWRPGNPKGRQTAAPAP